MFEPTIAVNKIDHSQMLISSSSQHLDYEYALVTGASKGLGMAIASSLARRGIHLLLVSLPGEGLAELCVKLKSNYKIEAEYFECDLAVMGDVCMLADCVKKHFRIFMLINNAGVGGSQAMRRASTDDIDRILKINVIGTSVLTQRLLPTLMTCKRSYILNVASIAAYTPVGYKTVYPASKAFIYHFSRGLSAELRDSQVTVTVVCPGAMMTNADSIRRMQRQGFFAQMIHENYKRVAEESVRQMIKGKEIVRLNLLRALALRVMPKTLLTLLATNRIKKELDT